MPSQRKTFITYFLSIDDQEKRETEFARYCIALFSDKKYNEEKFNLLCKLFPEKFLGFKYQKQLKKMLVGIELLEEKVVKTEDNTV